MDKNAELPDDRTERMQRVRRNSAVEAGLWVKVQAVEVFTLLFEIILDVCNYWLSVIQRYLLPEFWMKVVEARELRQCETYDEWHSKATEIDHRNGAEIWKMQYKSSEYDYELIHKRLQELRDCRKIDDWPNSAYLLRSTLDRNLGSISSLELFQKCYVGTKDLVEQYIDEVDLQLNYIASNGVPELSEKGLVDMFVQIREGYGRSALLLSGGAGLGMHHFGVIKALHESNLLPRIISGSSAGSLVGALVCVTRDEDLTELLSESTPALKSHYLIAREGEQLGNWDTVERLMFKGYLADVDVLKEACRANFGNMTFQEAYNMTHRILNITVNSTAHEAPRLLNYLASPNVVIWSAACASCALSGVFSEVELICKNKDGNLVPWNPHGMKWSDGSIETDLPMQHLREMFNVNHFIVSQVNPHVVPVLSCFPSLAERKPWWLKLTVAEIAHRLKLLIEMGIFPSALRRARQGLTQDYTGDITIVPVMEPEAYLQILSNPTPSVFERAVISGQRATWPKIGVIRNHCQIERTLETIVGRLRGLEKWRMM